MSVENRINKPAVGRAVPKNPIDRAITERNVPLFTMPSQRPTLGRCSRVVAFIHGMSPRFIGCPGVDFPSRPT